MPRHLHFLNDPDCYGAIKEVNDFFQHFQDDFRRFDYEPSLNVINQKDVEEFTKEFKKEFKIKKIPESTYIDRFYDFFNLKSQMQIRKICQFFGIQRG